MEAIVKGRELLSVVIPIYKKTQDLSFLMETIRKTRNASLPVEFILVQDGENITLENVLRSLSKQFNLIFTKGNYSSPGLARNSGLLLASAEWVTFWDCDDVGNAEEVLNAINSSAENFKVLVGNYSIRDLSNDFVTENRIRYKKLEILMINPGIWRFVFRRNFIELQKFSAFRMGEDQLFLCRLKLSDSIIKYVDETFYVYSKNMKGQLTGNSEAIFDLVPVIQELSRLTTDESYNMTYIHVVRMKLVFTALKHGKVGMNNLRDWRAASRDRKAHIFRKRALGCFYIFVGFVARKMPNK